MSSYDSKPVLGRDRGGRDTPSSQKGCFVHSDADVLRGQMGFVIRSGCDPQGQPAGAAAVFVSRALECHLLAQTLCVWRVLDTRLHLKFRGRAGNCPSWTPVILFTSSDYSIDAQPETLRVPLILPDFDAVRLPPARWIHRTYVF